MLKFFAGIGSRSTPVSCIPLIERICDQLVKKDYILRSGGADGADTYFFNAMCKWGGRSVVYIPWEGFNGLQYSMTETVHIVSGVTDDSIELAAQYHPIFHQLPYGAKKLMARNSCQVLGHDLHTPSDFIVYWQNPSKPGGTEQALRIARDRGIPTYNLFDASQIDQLLERIDIDPIYYLEQ